MTIRKTPAGKPSAARRQVGQAVAQRLDANPAVRRSKSEAIQLYQHPDFLDPGQCAALMRLIDANKRPSTLLSPSADPEFRTSESCDMDRWSPDVQPIDESVAALLGIEAVHGETMQGQRYAPGQQFRAHHDYFHENEGYWAKMVESGGQRTWTAMIFLNAVEEGGATWFPLAGVRVKPKPGLLLAWNNMAADGSPNENTLHEGMAVQAGVKYIITKWFREGAWIKN